jgi:hypothetical protein
MSDNVGYSPGAGATVAAKDVGGGVLMQRVITTFADINADGVIQRDPTLDNGLPVQDNGGAIQAVVELIADLMARVGQCDSAGRNRVILEVANAVVQTINVTQFGGSNVATGTGAGGAGVPRVTVSSDSSLAANQSVNVNQERGVDPIQRYQSDLNGPIANLYSFISTS